MGPLQVAAGTVAFTPVDDARITGGLWGQRRQINREVSVPQGWDRLHEAGNFHNLELAAGTAEGEYVSRMQFLDSDLYKWLEAVGWTLADPDLAESAADVLRERLAGTTELLNRAQQPDGYLDSWFQVHSPGVRFVDLAWGHELYCAGHLIQAAIAVRRGTGDSALLDIARRVADLIVATFGTADGQIDGVCGHPEIETALVELSRETGECSYLEAAEYFLDRRGNGLLGEPYFGRQYFQDHVPVREATGVAGHSVRQLYLLAGVADVVTETGESALGEAAARLWAEGAARQTYLTGGVGAHHRDEAYGDPYELPNERSYCETCAAIASIMFSWRMLALTGESRYADLLERTLYNGFLAGVSLDGERYIYANPLQVRDDHFAGGGDQDYARVRWFNCACCPPNVMRLIASLQHYLAVAAADEVRLHQFVPGHFGTTLDAGAVAIEVATDYPWRGRVELSVTESVPTAWTLTVRLPQWSRDGTLTVNGEPVLDVPADGWWRVTRTWQVGDRLVLDLPIRARLTRADFRVDATRGCLAVERGPLVYCLESVDQTISRLDDCAVGPDDFADVVETTAAGLPAEIVALEFAAINHARPASSWWPYVDVTESVPGATAEPVRLTAVPYFAWGNRAAGAMRIWLPSS